MKHPSDNWKDQYLFLPDTSAPTTVEEAFRLGWEACQRDIGKGVPSVDMVALYCRERGNNVDPIQWWDHYQSNGWHVGKVKMKDWKAAVRTWERSSVGRQQPQHPQWRTQA